MFYRFYRDEGEAGGGTVNAGAESTGTSGAEATGTLAAEGGQTSEGGEGAGAGAAQELTIEQQLEKSKADFNALTSEHDNLKVKIGKQSKDVGTFNQLTKAIKENPQLIINQIAKGANIDLSKVGESGTDMAKLFNPEATPEEQQTLLSQIQSDTRTSVLNEVKPVLDQIQEHNLSVKYSDWDERAESRDTVSVMRTTNQITDAEVNHLVSVGMDVPGALKVAGEVAVKEYLDGLQQKNDGQITGTGTSDGGGSSNEPQRIENFLENLSRN